MLMELSICNNYYVCKTSHTVTLKLIMVQEERFIRRIKKKTTSSWYVIYLRGIYALKNSGAP